MDSEENATSCSVCQEIYSDPRCLPCGHSFCFKCLKRVARNMQKLSCPICRFNVDLRNTDIYQLPKNFVFCNVIEAKEKKQSSMCLDHNKSLDLFCQRCNAVLYSKCLTMRHKGHAVEDIEIIYSERNKQYGVFLESTKQLALMIEEKRDAVKQSIITMEKNIDSISKTVENTFKKWNDALQKQYDAIYSYLQSERDKNMQVVSKAERILAGSMITVTGLDTDIRELRTKGTSFVIQQYRSLTKRQEDTECKILQDIQTCFTPPDNLVIEVYAPWIEEAINNIKHIDMTETQAIPGQQKIAEIQEENVILKRECAKLRNTQQELEKRKTNEVENLEYLDQCLDSLVQHLHDHIVSGIKCLPRTIAQPVGIKPESSIAKRYKHAQEICAQFTKVETEQKDLVEEKQKLEEEVQKLHNENKEQKQSYEKNKVLVEKEKTTLLADKQKGDSEIKRLLDEIKVLKQSEEKNKSLNEKLKKVEEANDNLNRQMQALQKENNELKYRLNQSPPLSKVISANDNKTIQQLKDENERLLSRLSELEGAQMTHKNPNIADLSDGFRPTKLSEEYSQLYYNLWTDAFEEHNGKKEEDIIKILTKGLLGSYEFCDNVCKEFTVQLTNSSLALPNSKPKRRLQDIPRVYQKQLKDMRKSFGVFLKNDVKESYRNKQNNIEGGDKTKNYIDACVELCWLMVIQDPPVVIEAPASKESAFDTNTYRAYTTTGTKVDFVVWPALRLHQGGPLLTKGVAQGKN